MEARMIEICNQISEDVENDIKELEGKPFTGPIVSDFLGKQSAAIKTLAEITKRILQKEIY